jgi:hypothetical protein
MVPVEVELIFSEDLNLKLDHYLFVSQSLLQVDSPRCLRMDLMTSQVPLLLHIKLVCKEKLVLQWETMHCPQLSLPYYLILILQNLFYSSVSCR